MCQDCNTTIYIFAVFVVSSSLIPTIKCSVFYINFIVIVYLILFDLLFIVSYTLKNIFKLKFYDIVLPTRTFTRLLMYHERSNYHTLFDNLWLLHGSLIVSDAIFVFIDGCDKWNERLNLASRSAICEQFYLCKWELKEDQIWEQSQTY